MEGGHLLGGNEEGCKLLFGYGGNEKLDDLGKSEEWAIVGWDGYVCGDNNIVP